MCLFVIHELYHVVAPSAVRNIKVKERTESLISLTWEEPEHLNGELLAYEVSLTPQNTPDHSSSPVLSNMVSLDKCFHTCTSASCYRFYKCALFFK